MIDKKIVIIGFAILVIIVGLVVFFIYRKRDSGSTESVILPDGRKLYQNKKFYDDKYQDTLKYLSAVYPTAKDDFENMNSLDLAKFYNSLWFYYNCDSSFKQNIVMPIKNKKGKFIQTAVPSCWEKLKGCGTTYPSIPYVPQGFLYSFNDWLRDWTPWFDSISDRNIQDVTGSFPGQTFSNFYNGPSPVWMYQRAIFRMVYDTQYPKLNDDFNKVPIITSGDIGEFKSDWNYPENWWLGVPDNGYMEVTAASEPGMPNSPPLCWIDGWPGSGLFVNVGKSFRSTNKANALFGLAKQMSTTEEGKDTLQSWWNSSEPYQIMKNLLYVNWLKGHNNLSFSKVSGPIIWDPVNKVKTDHCHITMNWVSNPMSIPYLPTNKNVGDFSNDADKGFWGTPAEYAPDFYSWCKESKDGKLNYITNNCIDDMRFDNNYYADRINNTIVFDEAIFAMAIYLGYDTVQMVRSSNGAGFWQYEIMLLYDYPKEAKQRDYSAFIEIDVKQTKGSTTCPVWNHIQKWQGGLKYRDDFTTAYMKNVYKYFSLRNPLDVSNNKKAKPVTPGDVWTPKYGEYNITAKNHISDMFTGMPIIGQSNNQCGNSEPSKDMSFQNIKRNSGFFNQYY